jgi:soluble lytic murein transglycosylase-like protein
MKNLRLVSMMLSLLTIPAATSQPVKSEAQRPDLDEIFKKAFFDASRIYGKAGCGDVTLAEQTARASIKTGLSANLIAAEIATESSCNPLAVSKDGGVGLMQIEVRVWAGKYNNFRDKNLLRTEDSIEVGCDILAENVKTWGLRQGIKRYNGSGPDAETYASKVMTLAGVR